MKCLFCGVELAPLRVVSNGLFCSDEHRASYELKPRSLDNARGPLTALIPLDWWLIEPIAAISAGPPDPNQPVPFYPDPPQLPQSGGGESTVEMPWSDQLFCPSMVAPVAMEITFKTCLAGAGDVVRKPHIPKWNPTPAAYAYPDFLFASPDETVLEDEVAAPEVYEPVPELESAGLEADSAPLETGDGTPEVADDSWRAAPPPWKRLAHAWKRSPIDLRLLTLVLPLIVLVAFSRSLPKLRIPPGSSIPNIPIQRVFSEGLGNFKQQLASRAAIDYTDDFRTGLDDWQGRGNTTAQWSYDATGFVRPGALALYRPTMSLSDYRFEFLGEIDDKAMGCAFRAANPDNYYAVKFLITQPGPVPLVKLVRYAVVNGHEERRQERPLPFLTRKDTLYRVLVDVRGSDFTIMSQGQVVDFWSDSRFKTGGVGLFCHRGERARVRWVEVSHQYDTLGKLCAYLAPYSGPGRTGSLN